MDDVQRLERELEDALESRDREVRRADSDRREMTRLQERIVALETEQQSLGQNVRRSSLNHVYCFERHFLRSQAKAEESLRQEIQGLLDELRESSNRNEELMADKDADMLLVQTLNNQLRDYKRKYEQAKTELRNSKGSILSQS